MAVSAALFALMNFFAKVASASAGWATVGGVRALVGAAVAVGFARARGRSLQIHDRSGIFLRSLFGTGAMMATFYALSSRSVGLGDTVTLLNLMPVFLALIAPFALGERTTLAVGLGIATALGGVVLVVRPSFLFGGGASARAVITDGPGVSLTVAVAVLAAFLSSFAMVMLRRVGQRETTESITFYFSLFAAIAFFFVAVIDFRLPTPRDAACMLLAGAAAGVAQIAMTRAYALERAARVSAMSYLSVVTSAVLGAAVLGERPSVSALSGMALVILGGVGVTFAKSPPSAPSVDLDPREPT